MLMGVKEIQEIIPHRHPFLLIDCIEELEPGVRAVGYKCVTYDESFFKGHFPHGINIYRQFLQKIENIQNFSDK